MSSQLFLTALLVVVGGGGCILLLCATTVEAQQQQQQQQQRRQMPPEEETRPPFVPFMTEELFDAAIPGRYFLKVDCNPCEGANCHIRRLFDNVWGQFMISPNVAADRVYRVDCSAGNDDFCTRLLGAGKLKRTNFSLMVMQLEANGEIFIEQYRGGGALGSLEEEPMQLISWLKGAVSGSLVGDSLESMVEAYNFYNPPYSSKDKPEIALLMLSTDGLGVRPDIWCRFLDLGAEQGVNVHLFLHIKNQQSSTEYCPHQEANHRIHRVPTILTQWTSVSLVRATLNSLKSAVAKFGGAERYALVSDNSIPLVDPKQMLEELRGPSYNHEDGSSVSVFQQFDEGRPSDFEKKIRYGHIRPRLQQKNQQNHPQAPLELSPSDFDTVEMWWILDEPTGAWFANHDYTQEFEFALGSDETYYVSLCKKFGLPFKLASAHRHGASAASRGAAEMEMESHPMYTEWLEPKSQQVHAEVIDAITKTSIARWSQDNQHSFLFARKIDKDTTIDLSWLTTTPPSRGGGSGEEL